MRRYENVVVANGHHWDPRWPEPSFPGAETFPGDQLHAHYYKTPEIFAGKRVLVLGIGNSACDIAVESSRTAEETFLAMRRGHIVPKFVFGVPTDHLTDSALARGPLQVQQLAMAAMLRVAQGRVTDYGLPKPDHAVLHAHPTVSDDLLTRLGHGDITVKPNIDRFEGRRSSSRTAPPPRSTGRLLHRLQGDLPVLRRRHGGHRRRQPRRPVPAGGRPRAPRPVLRRADPAARRDHAARRGGGVGGRPRRRRGGAPSYDEMRAQIARYDEQLRRRYVASKRHTIQVDFHKYRAEIERERAVAGPGQRDGAGAGTRGAGRGTPRRPTRLTTPPAASSSAHTSSAAV